jgi:N-acetylmuramic acid 6-phosphate etherase
MALAGSTRLQATTVLMLAAGWALLEPAEEAFAAWLERYIRRVRQIDFTALAPLTEAEADVYDVGDYVTYETSRYAITVLTDTTERAPTFNLTPFENQGDPSPEPSLCYLALPDADDAEAAWRRLLARPPRPLDWPEYTDVVGSERLMGFDFSQRAHAHRRDRLPRATHHRFPIHRRGDRMELQLRGHSLSLPVDGLTLLQEHVLLKLLLNCHSTLLMGRLGRFQSNVMTWVKPSNRKLIDRAIRYVEQLLRTSDGPRLSYEETARALFRQIPKLAPDRSIVLETVAAIRAAHARPAGSNRP